MGCTDSKPEANYTASQPTEIPPSTSPQSIETHDHSNELRDPLTTQSTQQIQQKTSNNTNSNDKKSKKHSKHETEPLKSVKDEPKAAVPSNTPSSSATKTSTNTNAGSVTSSVSSQVQKKKEPEETAPIIPIMPTELIPDEGRFAEKYELGEVVGEGAFSTVRLARNRRTKEKAAVKCISKKALPADDEAALKQEVIILRAMNHPNILKCLGFYDEETTYYLVMEYMEGGELFDRIVKKTFYSEKEARDLVYILLSTIHYCHARNVVHRDLKPENLLLASLDDDAHVKLADFGFAIKSEGYMTLKTQCGTPGYVAPEILSTQPYGKAVDMWSIGGLIEDIIYDLYVYFRTYVLMICNVQYLQGLLRTYSLVDIPHFTTTTRKCYSRRLRMPNMSFILSTGTPSVKKLRILSGDC